MGKKLKAQSAMEYLMTYGWAILIIAVVLGALFSLGVFNGASLLGTSCVAGSGYLCQNPVLSTSGQLTFTFGQNTGANVYNGLIYVENQSSVPGAYPSYFTSSVGKFTITANPLTAGQTIPVSVTVPGYAATIPIGTPFTGYVWLAYNGTGTTGTQNLLVKVATITVKAS